MLVFTSLNGNSSELFKDLSIYPLGYVRHFELAPKVNDGNLNYFAVSKTRKKNAWRFESGVGTFVDSYHKRAYIFFSDISHENYQYGLFRPVLNVHCAYKGHSSNEDDRKLQCYPSFKLRVGNKKGLFINLIPIPKVGGVTNGLMAFEIGYKF